VRFQLAIFDFDGTLVDSREPIARSANDALAAAGLPERSPAEVHALVGLPLADVLARLAGAPTAAVPASLVEQLCTVYRARFGVHAAGRTPLFDGVREMIDRVAARGLRLAIATSRGRASAEAILEDHGLADRFAARLGGGCVERGKPHPEMVERILAQLGVPAAATLLVGDTTFDIEMGRAAGVATCGVTYGSHGAELLRAAGATHVIHRPAELLPLL